MVLEGPDVRSVQPVLKALESAWRAKYVRHHLNDRDDLHRQLKRWGQAQHGTYNIGYIALHGSPGTVHIGRYKVDLAAIGPPLPAKALAGKVLHFGSCSVLNLNDEERQELRQALGVRALTGFTTNVEWFESMAFELLLFDALTYYKRPSDAEKYLHRRHGQLADHLGFVMVR